jgi:hypothetical protein
MNVSGRKKARKLRPYYDRAGRTIKTATARRERIMLELPT